MRTEAAVKAEILEARHVRHESDGGLTEKQSTSGSNAIRALMAELSDILTDGAINCPDCGQKPHGNHKQEARFVLNQETGIETQAAPDIYVVRCLECEPRRYIENEAVSADGKSKRITSTIVFPSAKGETVTEAVENWNAGNRIETREIANVKMDTETASR